MVDLNSFTEEELLFLRAHKGVPLLSTDFEIEETFIIPNIVVCQWFESKFSREELMKYLYIVSKYYKINLGNVKDYFSDEEKLLIEIQHI